MAKQLLVLIMLQAYGMPWQAALAQTGSVRGQVRDQAGHPLPGATVRIEVLGLGTAASADGAFRLTSVPTGVYRLSASYLGYLPSSQTITVVAGEALEVPFHLKPQANTLAGVEIAGKGEVRQLKESPFHVAALDARSASFQTASTADLLNRVAGVRVRQEGGLGSNANVSLNGVAGKQVKFFLDGIPLEFYGPGFSLATLPLHLAERVEVYKGVVPAELGADALGGAVQVISRQHPTSHAAASYSAGSFNTHRATLDARWMGDSSRFTFGVSAFYNHSDNDYRVEAEVVNAFGNPEKRSVHRFHDSFTNYMGQVQAGLGHTRWADELLLRLTYSGQERDLQHGVTMRQVFGAITVADEAQGASLQYRKRLWQDKLEASLFTGLNHLRREFIDTTLYGYNWLGQVTIRRSFGGESGASRNFLRTATQTRLSRANVRFRPAAGHILNLNLVHTGLRRVGREAVAAEFYETDIFALPTLLDKTSLGLAYERQDWRERLTSVSSVKYFHFRSSGFNFEKNAGLLRVAKARWGANQAFTYRWSDRWLSKASYEYATRLPDEIELLGYVNVIRPNPELRPERSHNLNAGLQRDLPGGLVELNGFYRLVQDNIFLPPSLYTFSRYQNLFRIRVAGVEGEITKELFRQLQVSANATYQDLRHKADESLPGSAGRRYHNARLPNHPFMFGHAELRYQVPDALRAGNTLQVWAQASYVHWFYLNWSIDGRKDTKAVIPTQVIFHAGVGYSLFHKSLQTSLEVLNLTDARAFDNFSVQRPGRAVNLKLSYLFQKNT